MSTAKTRPGMPLWHHRVGPLALLSIATLTGLYWNAERIPGVAGATTILGKSSNASLQPLAAPHRAPDRAEEEALTQLDTSADGEVLQMNTALLEQGKALLSRTQNYSATFVKREQIDGELRDNEIIELKLQHRPFRVYMKWTEGEAGRELLYDEEENDGQMLVHAGGIRGRILRSVRLDPEGSFAMSETRHPVTKIGMSNLTDEVLARRMNDLRAGCDIRCRTIDDQRVANRPCHCFSIEWPSQSVSPDYRKSIHFIDKELSLLIGIKNYGWPENHLPTSDEQLDAETMIEHYMYTDIRLDHLTESDFDSENSAYHF